MATYLVTGAAGFFGAILARRLSDEGHATVLIDRLPIAAGLPCLKAYHCDLRDADAAEEIFKAHRFDGVFHVAAILAHDRENRGILWDSNVTATRHLKTLCERYGVTQLVFTSTNCLWARDFENPVTEDEPPAPVEIYGRSKCEAEKILLGEASNVSSVVFRCPTIIDTGRLGLLSILFEFIEENRTVWTVGSGANRYQFIYAQDLASACIAAISHPTSALFHIGADNVPSMREMFQGVIAKSGSASKVRGLPQFPTIPLMKLAYHSGLSPLGPYHYKMIANTFVFDTQKLKRELGWRPTLDNVGMMAKAYDYYKANKARLAGADAAALSAHNKPADMGIIRLLKWLS